MKTSHLAVGDRAAGSLAHGCRARRRTLPSAQQDAGPTRRCPDEPADDATAADRATIIVTGSRIRRPNLESTVPITSIAGEQFFQQGQHQRRRHAERSAAAAQHLRAAESRPRHRHRRPQPARSSRPRHARARWCWSTAAATSRRTSSTTRVSPDINTIPNDLIERVDIVTGGNSAIYGSDAIAGVVNFVLRRDFDGLQVRGQAGIIGPRASAATSMSRPWPARISPTTAATSRCTANMRIRTASSLRTSRSCARVDGLGIVDADPAGLRQRQRRLSRTRSSSATSRSRNDQPLGLVSDHPAAMRTPACGTAASARRPNSAGPPFNCTYRLRPGRNADPADRHALRHRPDRRHRRRQRPDRARGPTVSVLPTSERYNVNLLAHYRVQPSVRRVRRSQVEPRQRARHQRRPVVHPGHRSAQFDRRERPRLDNPFLQPGGPHDDRQRDPGLGLQPRPRDAARAATARAGTTGGPLTAAAARSDHRRHATASLGRAQPARRRHSRREVPARHLSASSAACAARSTTTGATKSRPTTASMEEDTTTNGFIDRQRFVLCARRRPQPGDRARSSAARSSIRPRRSPSIRASTGGTIAPTRAAPRLAADIAACVPYNPFGAGRTTRGVDNYFARDLTPNGSGSSQFVAAAASCPATLSQLFELPGGPISFALGAEYRREDGILRAGSTFVDRRATPTTSCSARVRARCRSR